MAATGGPGGLGQNATESLVELTDRSDLDGLDIDYEAGPAGLDDPFVDCMSQLLIDIGSPRMEGFASIAPSGRPRANLKLSTSRAVHSFLRSTTKPMQTISLTCRGIWICMRVSPRNILLDTQGSDWVSHRASAPLRGLQPPDIYPV